MLNPRSSVGCVTGRCSFPRMRRIPTTLNSRANPWEAQVPFTKLQGRRYSLCGQSRETGSLDTWCIAAPDTMRSSVSVSISSVPPCGIFDGFQVRTPRDDVSHTSCDQTSAGRPTRPRVWTRPLQQISVTLLRETLRTIPILFYPTTNWLALLVGSRPLAVFHLDQRLKLPPKFGHTVPTPMMIGRSLGTIWMRDVV